MEEMEMKLENNLRDLEKIRAKETQLEGATLPPALGSGIISWFLFGWVYCFHTRQSCIINK